MGWTNEDEAAFQKRKREHFAREAEDDAEREKLAKCGLAPKCPACGSHRYSEGTYHEICNDCGLSQRY